MMMKLIENALVKADFTHYAPLKLENIVFEESLRSSCEMNTCRMFGGSYSCPPHIGEIKDCIGKVKGYSKGFIFQYVGQLEDPYDFESMMDAQNTFKDKTLEVRKLIDSNDILLLGAGPCTVCKECAFKRNAPCVFPDKMISSVEAHGIFVNPTLVNCGLKYNNGENTVSYCGIVMIK